MPCEREVTALPRRRGMRARVIALKVFAKPAEGPHAG
jgi:hypothetical protein